MNNKPSIKAIKKKNYSQIAYDSLLDYISDYLKHSTEDDELKLPPEVQLAEMMSISRATLRPVLTELEANGRIRRVHGKGTFINRNYKEATPFLDCNKLIEHQGYAPSHKVLSVEKVQAPETVKQKLNCMDLDFLWKMDTVYYANGAPCIIIRDWILPGSDKEKIDSALMEQSFFEFLMDVTGKRGTSEQSVLYADISSSIENEFSDVAFSSPAMMVYEAVLYDESNAPICTATGYFNPEYIRFNLYGKITE